MQIKKLKLKGQQHLFFVKEVTTMDQDRSELKKDGDDNNIANPKKEETEKKINRFRVKSKEVIDETEKERMRKDAEKFDIIVDKLLAEKERPGSAEE